METEVRAGARGAPSVPVAATEFLWKCLETKETSAFGTRTAAQ